MTMKNINAILGEKVKLIRNTHKITRERLAELIDVSPRFLAEVEAGKVGVSLQTLKNLSMALSTSTDFLLGLDNESKPSQLEIIYHQLTHIDEKFYPLIFSLISELKNIN